MSIDRSTILRGPCKIAYDDETFFSRGDVSVKFSTPLFDKVSAAYGRHGQGVEDKMVEVSFTPVTYTADQAAVLWPYASTAIGASIYGATDKPLVITPINGQPLTIANARVTSIPDMVFSPIQNFWGGDVTFTGLCANDSDPTLVASYYSWGTAASGVNIGANWDPSKDLYLPYSMTHNSVTYEAYDGFKVSGGLSLSPVKPDNYGTVDMTLTSHAPTLAFKPIGKTEAQIETLFSKFGIAIGASATGHDIVLAGPNEDDLQFTLSNCTPGADDERSYGPEADRLGELTFEAQRAVTAGVPDALYAFGTVPGA
ncbi:hypothetical protein ACWPKS_15965 [Coraliomargarita sp. W4R72]